MEKKVLIIDYKLGNILSVKRALEYNNARVEISNDLKKILQADRIILPGVGHFGLGVKNLTPYKDAILEFILKSRPIMGICLGMQLMFESSEEDNFINKGLGVIKGSVKKFNNKNVILPHVGWRTIGIDKNIKINKIFDGVDPMSKFYFTHYFYCLNDTGNLENYYSIYYGTKFNTAIIKDNIYLFQFHPEKSSYQGLKIYKNFINL